MEHRHIRPRGEFNPHGITGPVGLVILGQAFAHLACSHANDAVVRQVRAHAAAEHLGSEHPLLQTLEVAVEGLRHHELHEFLASLAAPECRARQNTLELQTNLALYVRRRRFFGLLPARIHRLDNESIAPDVNAIWGKASVGSDKQ